MRGAHSIDADIYVQPDPAAVARLIDSHGLEAACARWHWVGERTLGSLARTARAQVGEAPRRSRARSFSDLEAAVCVEASFIFGSGSRGERAAGIHLSASQSIFPARGLTAPAMPYSERGEVTRLGQKAKRGDAGAVAEKAARHAQEQAVGAVLRAALALVQDQARTGRYRLPPQDEVLRAALEGLPPDAVAAVFPGLADLSPPAESPAIFPVPASPEPPVSDTTLNPGWPHVRGRLPDENILRCDHAAGQSIVTLAAFYGVHPQTLYSGWRDLGLSGKGRMSGFTSAVAQRAPEQAEAPEPTAPLPVRELPLVLSPKAPTTEPAMPRPVRDLPVALSPQAAIASAADREAAAPLGLYHLSLAVRLVGETGISKAAALEWVREDIRAVAMARALPSTEEIEELFRELARHDDEGDR